MFTVIHERLESFATGSILLSPTSHPKIIDVLCGNCKRPCGHFYGIHEQLIVVLERFRVTIDYPVEMVRYCEKTTNPRHNHHYVFRSASVLLGQDQIIPLFDDNYNLKEHTRTFRRPFFPIVCEAICSEKKKSFWNDSISNSKKDDSTTSDGLCKVSIVPKVFCRTDGILYYIKNSIIAIQRSIRIGSHILECFGDELSLSVIKLPEWSSIDNEPQSDFRHRPTILNLKKTNTIFDITKLYRRNNRFVGRIHSAMLRILTYINENRRTESMDHYDAIASTSASISSSITLKRKRKSDENDILNVHPRESIDFAALSKSVAIAVKEAVETKDLPIFIKIGTDEINGPNVIFLGGTLDGSESIKGIKSQDSNSSETDSKNTGSPTVDAFVGAIAPTNSPEECESPPNNSETVESQQKVYSPISSPPTPSSDLNLPFINFLNESEVQDFFAVVNNFISSDLSLNDNASPEPIASTSTASIGSVGKPLTLIQNPTPGRYYGSPRDNQEILPESVDSSSEPIDLSKNSGRNSPTKSTDVAIGRK